MSHEISEMSLTLIKWASDPIWEKLVIMMTENLKEVHGMSVDLLVNRSRKYMKTSK